MMNNTRVNRRPRLLIIAGYFPPVRISSGSIRPWNIAHYLTALGWDVTVLTPNISIWKEQHLDDVDATKKSLQKSGVKVIYTQHWWRFLSPERYKVSTGKANWFFGGVWRVLARVIGMETWIGWLPSALKACSSLKPDDVDVILATGAPYTGFKIANLLAKKLNKPYMLDYRDLWTNNPWLPKNKKWLIEQEKRLIQSSSAISVVSPLSGVALDNRFCIGAKLHIITNGYDAKELQTIYAQKFDHFSIIFAGSLIPPKLTLYPLLKSLSQLKKSSAYPTNWMFHYFGPNTQWVNSEITEWGLEDKAIIHGNLPRAEVLPYLKGANLAVVISSNSKNPTLEDQGVIPGKIFELIGLGTPIISIGPDRSAVQNIVEKLDNGFHCKPGETEKLVEFIGDCLNGRKFKMEGIEFYSWETLSRKFDEVLRDMIEQ